MNRTIGLYTLFCLFIWPFTGIAQNPILKEAKNYYKEQPYESCLRPYSDKDSTINQVILIRHGEPDLNKKGCRNRDGAKSYAIAYDTVGVKPFDPLPVCSEKLSINYIYHSNLQRAKHTAELTFGDPYILIEDARFREFERKVAGFINMKLPLKFWMGLSRGLWFMGLNDKGIENFKSARKRAKENATFLADEATDEGLVILVAHGMHNKYVAKYLKKSGWKMVRKGGSGYTSVNILAKVAD